MLLFVMLSHIRLLPLLFNHFALALPIDERLTCVAGEPLFIRAMILADGGLWGAIETLLGFFSGSVTPLWHRMTMASKKVGASIGVIHVASQK